MSSDALLIRADGDPVRVRLLPDTVVEAAPVFRVYDGDGTEVLVRAGDSLRCNPTFSMLNKSIQFRMAGPEPPRPAESFVQWKGTKVCMDWSCACDPDNDHHVDADFAYALECPTCGAVWRLPSTLRLLRDDAYDGVVLRRVSGTNEDDDEEWESRSHPPSPRVPISLLPVEWAVPMNDEGVEMGPRVPTASLAEPVTVTVTTHGYIAYVAMGYDQDIIVSTAPVGKIAGHGDTIQVGPWTV